MKDLISRSALLEALENDRMIFRSTITVSEALLAQGEHWRRCLESAPAVDAVPVVRCGKCEHKHAISCEGIVLCTYHGKMIQMKSSDFCSYGERRSE